MRETQSRGLYSPKKVGGWGHSMVNKLDSLTRKRRKREVSKMRRAVLRDELEYEREMSSID